MTKYTIKKAFQKAFPFPIWKIEVDEQLEYIAIEYRNPADTLPFFSVLTFQGDIILEGFPVSEKEWTLAAVYQGKLILKNYGHDSPLQAGIKIIDITQQTEDITFLQFVFQEVLEGYIKAKHRSIPSGLFYYINIQTGEYLTHPLTHLTPLLQDITWPSIYSGKIPAFMQHVIFNEHIWLQKVEDHFIWAYHTKENNTYNLVIALSTKNELLKEKVVLKNLPKLILQPYFKVNHNILILSDNKEEIVSYLV